MATSNAMIITEVRGDDRAIMLALGVMLVLSMLGSFIASTLVQPFVSAGTTVLYADERMRQEAWDVELNRASRERRDEDLSALAADIR